MNVYKSQYRLFSLIIALYMTVAAYAVTHQQVMGFEVVDNIWVTEADLSEFNLGELWCERIQGSSYSQLRNDGAWLSADYVKQGQYCLKWSKLNEFPSLSTVDIDHDWSGFNTVTFWVYSTVATNQKLYFVLQSDSTATAWKDFYYKPFAIDWQGWRRIVLQFEDFNEYETVAGFDKIDSVGFYAKLFNAVPNPYTVLYFDDMRLLDAPSHDINRDGIINMVDYSQLIDQWNMKLAAEEDFSSAVIRGDISSSDWYGIYGSVTADIVVEQTEISGKTASIIYGANGGKYRKDFSGNNISSTDRYVYISADITPVKYAGNCYDIWAGFWAKFFAGVYIGFTPASDGSSWQCAVTKTGGNTILTDNSFPVVSAQQYRVSLQMDTQSSTGSMFIKNLTAGDISYSALPELQNVDLSFTSSNNPSKWERFFIELTKNGNIDNIVLTAGQEFLSLPLNADVNGDSEVDIADIFLLAENWLITY